MIPIVLFRVILVGLLVSFAKSKQLVLKPLGLGGLGQSQSESESQRQSQDVRNIAIVGAGAAGSACASYLAQYAELRNVAVNITVFESSNRVGGRSTTLAKLYNDSSMPDVELGASIFISKNEILMELVERFNLTLQRFSVEEKNDSIKESTGIWDGQEWKYRSDGSTWSKWKYYLKFGPQFWKLRKLVDKVVDQMFLQWFYSEGFPFERLNDVEDEMKLLVNHTAAEYLQKQGFRLDFIAEFVSTLTRVNYSQDVDQIHALGALVTLAALFGDVYQVKGGNFQIFERFLEESGAEVMLETQVVEIGKFVDEGEVKYELLTANLDEYVFDQVVLLSPLASSGIQFTDMDVELLLNGSEPQYVELHVYIVTSGSLISSEYFHEHDLRMPTMITTIAGERAFFSINLVDYHDSLYVYKIFSDEPELDLGRWFGAGFELVHHQKWQSYPILQRVDWFPDFELDINFWYLNTMEAFFSTMESECLVAANVLSLISYRYEHPGSH